MIKHFFFPVSNYSIAANYDVFIFVTIFVLGKHGQHDSYNQV